MIKKFSTLYAGHLDLDNIGLEGTPANERRYSNEYLVSAFDKAEATAVAMDRLGYDTLWLAEHHFHHEGYECIPNLLMLSVHLAKLTENLKFGCAFNIVPMWHPLRLAEDFAMADILTNGRVTFGVGRGYHTREVETFGAPLLDSDANRDLFEEQVEIILKAFNQESFSHHGKHYDIPPQVPYRGYELEEITLVPRPIHRPVETWQPIVSSSPRSIDFMARHGIKGMVIWSEETGEQKLRLYRDAAATYGRELQLGEDMCVGFSFFLDDSGEKAMLSAKKIFEEGLKFGAPLGLVRNLTDEQIGGLAGRDAVSVPGLPTIGKATQDRGWLCGSPEEVTAFLQEFQERYPALDHVNVNTNIGTSGDDMVEQLGRFAREVMPAFV